MSKTIRRMYFIWDLDKEKAFLEDMATKGYKLSKVKFGKYVFDEFEPKKLAYQFDFRVLDRKKEHEYLSYFDGWEYIGRFGPWYYFAAESTDESSNTSLFNDNQSKRDQLKRILGFLLLIGFPLYFQLIIVYPNLENSTSRLKGFYLYFKYVISVLGFLHMFALIRILLMYNKLRKSITE